MAPLCLCLFFLLNILSSKSTLGFVVPSSPQMKIASHTCTDVTRRISSSHTSALPISRRLHTSQLYADYVPQEPELELPTAANNKKSLHPQVGDVVRYYDLDGGDQKGQELVGKISYITSVLSKDGGDSQNKNQEFIVDLTQLEDTGDGYYAEFSSQKRMGKKATRNLQFVSPIIASYVRAEQAFKVPRTTDNQLRVRQETYDLEDYQGPVIKINPDIVAQDGVTYGTLKFNLLKNAAITGLAGSVVVNIVKGPEDGAIYLAGAIASVGYLFFLSVKTDTLASKDAKLGSGLANLRFLMPLFVLVGVALYNQSKGDLNPMVGNDAKGGTFDTVTGEQFGAAVLGFLTYRVPLFIGQVKDAFAGEEGDDVGTLLPGSAGVAMQLLKGDEASSGPAILDQNLTPVLLVSGPQFTGRKELVQQLLDSNYDDRLVKPMLIDRQQDGVTFERLEERGEFLQVDPTGRYGLTKDAILEAASGSDDGFNSNKVVVVDADVGLARQLETLSGTRLVGVWVGLNTVSDFEERLEDEINAGKLIIPEDEPRESFLRAKVKEIVSEIEFGLGSGIFEFTILNDGSEKSLKELKDAAEYSFADTLDVTLNGFVGETSGLLLSGMIGKAANAFVWTKNHREGQIRSVVKKVHDTLVAAHKQSVYHLDIQTGNIVVNSSTNSTEYMDVLVINWGVAITDGTRFSFRGCYPYAHDELLKKGREKSCAKADYDWASLLFTYYHLHNGDLPWQVLMEHGDRVYDAVERRLAVSLWWGKEQSHVQGHSIVDKLQNILSS
ncbi:MAG: hypothetical protein SGBAC_011228 [Bacillariaceae sp.]